MREDYVEIAGLVCCGKHSRHHTGGAVGLCSLVCILNNYIYGSNLKDVLRRCTYNSKSKQLLAAHTIPKVSNFWLLSKVGNPVDVWLLRLGNGSPVFHYFNSALCVRRQVDLLYNFIGSNFFLFTVIQGMLSSRQNEDLIIMLNAVTLLYFTLFYQYRTKKSPICKFRFTKNV